jgi:signal transduction histidine kinase
MDLARPGRGVRLAVPIVAALALFAVGWPTAHVELGLGAAAAMVAGLAAAGPVALAGIAPGGAWALSALGAGLVTLAGHDAPTGLAVPTAHVVALGGLLLVVGVRSAPWPVVGATLGTVGVLASGATAASALPALGVGIVMTVVLAVLARQVVGSRRALARSEERVAAEQARAAVLEERSRIARDLHDVVAHSMSLVVVRAQSARYRVPGTSDAMAGELSAIADTARGALGELRGVLGVLRSPGDGADGAPVRPQPGPADVTELLESTRAAGVELTVTRVGDLADAGPAVVVSVHRILSEALANATRHAGGAPVAVHLEHDESAVRLRVTNGPGRDLAGPGSGLGLTMMRERAAAVGGELRAGRGPDGFVVDAVLPATTTVEVPA